MHPDSEISQDSKQEIATEMESLTEVWQHVSFAKQDHLKMGALASGNLLYAAGSSNPALCDNLEG